jgi:hypothetical protein
MNLLEILKDVPEGTEFYCTLIGDCILVDLDIEDPEYAILVNKPEGKADCWLQEDGTFKDGGECVLFPSKNQRDWTKFERPCQFKDGEAVWVRNHPEKEWECRFHCGEVKNNNHWCYSLQKKEGSLKSPWIICVPYEPRPF